ASHNSEFLWRLHAVHHSPEKLYWLNVGRFHPLEKAIQFLFDALPFILVGVSEEVLSLYFVFYAINGFFQHCNIELRFGFLNYIISSPELHRWHHSRLIHESNSNYGNNIIIWDLLFGTRYFPKDAHVKELGLINNRYPDTFQAQLKTPFTPGLDKKDVPLLSFKEVMINFLIKLRMFSFRYQYYLPMKRAAKNPYRSQEKFLMNLVRKNRDTKFGQAHSFDKIHSYDTFKALVPVQEYEMLRPYIDHQEATKEPGLNHQQPLMYNQTSGTTGQPKYIPVLQDTLDDLKKSQSLMAYTQYRSNPRGFSGGLVALVSPAIEGHLESGTPYGSASGHIYKNSPKIMQTKYLIPAEVFEIEDYFVKYYVIIRLAIEHKNVTYLGSPNPSTFLRLLDIIETHRKQLVEDIAQGTLWGLADLPLHISQAVQAKLAPNRVRAAELNEIFSANVSIGFDRIWPNLQILSAWTGGSCGIALEAVKEKLPPDTTIIELGYLASELRGTILMDGDTTDGIPTFQENFFEFVEKGQWEDDHHEFLTLDQVQEGREYYIFVTTGAGLYRYNMNDIVKVTGFFEKTPLIRFIQKGKGITSLTGEKLYEGQVIDAVMDTVQALGLTLTFFQLLANQDGFVYELYIECQNPAAIAPAQMAVMIEENLSKRNLEYKAKRLSGRLQPLVVYPLKNGTFEQYKKDSVEKGQREGQFKTVALQYKQNFTFSFDAFIQDKPKKELR
ncbi:MAG: GH3 auxin-responsive promoter family protein, partial [Chloroflexota bacterium]